MTKRKVIRRSNKPFTYNPHYYSWGGDFMKAIGGKDTLSLKKTFSGANVGKMFKSGLASAAGNMVGSGANKLLSNGLESGAGSAINKVGSTLGSAVGAINPLMGAAVSAASGVLSGVTNSLFGSKLNDEKIQEIEEANKTIGNTTVDNSSADAIEKQWGTQDFGKDFTQSDVGKDGLFNSKASDKYKELKRQQEIARNRTLAAYNDAVTAADTQADLNAQANFAAFGGTLNTNGGDFTNGQTIIGNGGTHEENPMEGVPMGIDAEGTPNLVEQGEVIFNDYVFSNRLFADGGLLESFNLPKSYENYSFAAIAEKLGNESKERPNDPISKRGLLNSMSKLQQAQEIVRQQAQESQEGIQYAHGGKMGTLFSGLGSEPNLLDGVEYGDWQDYGTLLEPIDSKYVARAAAKRTGYNVGSSLQDYYKNPMEKEDNSQSKLTLLRYAPVIGAAIGLGQNLFSRPDYTSADTILEAANQAGNHTPIGYTPIGDYLQYRPFDRNFHLNKLNAQAGATRRAIMNTTSPSRNAALLAADYNAQGRLGDLARQAEEYNLAQRQAVETFNRATNQANAEMGLQAAIANQKAALNARSSRLSGIAQAMSVRDAVDARRGASISANLTNFFNSLGDIGKEEFSRNMIMSNPALYYSIDSKGNVSYKNGYESLSEAEKKEVRNAANKAKNKRAKGGYLTIKKGNRQ